MAIATRLEEFLDSNSLSYDINAHEHAETGMRNAEAAHLPGDIVAKSVLLKDGDNYMLVVLPATHMLDLGQLHRKLDRHV
ncbi:aminoacyl-tRNA deacylase, partial [Solemya velum gill symbiont]